MWVFDTDTNSWSSLDAAVGDVPKARDYAAASASAQPQPKHQRTDENVAPQLPPDPANMVPEPLTPSTYGTFVVFGGVCEGEDRYVDFLVIRLYFKFELNTTQAKGPFRGTPLPLFT